MKDTLLKNGMMLGVFAVVTTALISLTFMGTESRIAAQQQAKLLSVLNEVVPHSLHDNALYLDCVSVSSPLLSQSETRIFRAYQGTQPSAFAVEATAPDGYSGNINIVVGVATDLTVLGVRVLEHKETPGLGDKIELSVSDWILSFTNKHYNQDSDLLWRVKKDGGEYDQFTGATITPRAVVAAVKRAAQYIEAQQSTLDSLPNHCALDQKTNEEAHD